MGARGGFRGDFAWYLLADHLAQFVDVVEKNLVVAHREGGCVILVCYNLIKTAR